jgi:transposase
MINYREILRLNSLGYSQRNIAAGTGSSRNTVSDVLKKASRQNITWPLDEDITNSMLDELLSSKAKNNSSKSYAEPNYEYIHKELSKKGVTLTLLWNEYCERAYANGETPYMSTQFGDKYRRWARVTKATMRVTHKPGDTMQVDWAGGTIPYFDSVTGEEYKAYLFVAALPCSGYVYVEACTDMKQENWLMCHVHAYSYFGGVTRILVPDNLKTGVTANTRYETQLNESYHELAEYYGTAIVPARVRKPQDKGLVEKSVGFSTTLITAALRERKFFSFTEVKEAVEERLEFINTKPFQKRPGNRREAYLAEEKEFMLSLPNRPYEPSVWKQQTVGNDYLVTDGMNKYSVPFDLIGEQVQIRLTKNIIEIFFKGSRVTSHKRLENYQHQPVVKTEHMPDNHREYLSYNADEFKVWAKQIGSSTSEVVKHFLNSGSAPEQGYKACVSLKKLGKRYGKKKLESACERMLAFSSVPSIRTITTILKNSKEDKQTETVDNNNKYGITRGAAYWKKGGDGNA